MSELRKIVAEDLSEDELIDFFFADLLKVKSAARYYAHKYSRSAPSLCEWCGKKPPHDRHHPDYSRKLDILWVCKSCHAKIHHARKNKLKAEPEELELLEFVIFSLQHK